MHNISRFGRGSAAAAIGVAVAVLGLAEPARAQIYSWRDANGNLVLSETRPNAGARTYAVPQAEAVRVTRPLVAISPTRGLYDDLISEHAQLNGIRSDLVRAVVQVESGFNPYARSPKGAMGLMQLMPATIRAFSVRNPFSPLENIRAGVAYLRRLLDRYSNNEELALAAYNAGPSAVDRHGAVPPYRETKNYVIRINKMAPHTLQAPGKKIYKTMEIVDGRPVTRYTDRRPTDGGFEVVNSR